jgi:hypothetical protein
VGPPSTMIDCPVTYEASGEVLNRTTGSDLLA